METTLVEAALNASLVAADIGRSHEEYLDVIDRFYADDIEAACEGFDSRIVGKKQLTATVASWLFPLHMMAEIGGLAVVLRLTGATPSDVHGTNNSEWVLELTGTTGSRCSVSWSCLRTWRGAKVISEFHYNHQRSGAPLGIHDLRFSSDATRVPFQRTTPTRMIP